LVGGVGFGEPADEGAADDGRVGARTVDIVDDLSDVLRGGDAEANGEREIGDLAEFADACGDGVGGEAGCVGVAGDAGAGEDVDEASAGGGDLRSALRLGGGGDEEGAGEAGGAGAGGEICGFFERHIGEDEAVEAGGLGVGDEAVGADAVDDGDADHRDEAEVWARAAGLGDRVVDTGGGGAALEGFVHGGGDHGTVGDRVAEGVADFDDAGSGALEGGEELGRVAGARVLGADEGHEGFAVGRAEGGEDGGDAGHGRGYDSTQHTAHNTQHTFEAGILGGSDVCCVVSEGPQQSGMQPIVLSTWSFGPVANEPAMRILRGGGAALDAVVAGATAVEDDPTIQSVGVGGLPDAEGRVSLDGCVMTDPNRCGSVACLRHHANPCEIARRVMEKTIHVMLAGEGADAFADREGFARRELLTAEAKAEWEKWAKDPKNLDRAKYQGWIPPQNVEEKARSQMANRTSQIANQDKAKGDADRGSRVQGGDGPRGSHDTVCVLARDSRGQLAGACSTSGMAFKVPGRVGDSPIIGHGLYVDQRGGAAAATGNGELVMGVCGSFLAVELMRGGARPLDAIVEVLKRICARFELGPDHQVAMIAMTPRGEWGSGAIRPGFRHTITDERGTRVEEAQRVVRI